MGRGSLLKTAETWMKRKGYSEDVSAGFTAAGIRAVEQMRDESVPYNLRLRIYLRSGRVMYTDPSELNLRELMEVRRFVEASRDGDEL